MTVDSTSFSAPKVLSLSDTTVPTSEDQGRLGSTSSDSDSVVSLYEYRNPRKTVVTRPTPKEPERLGSGTGG